MKSEFEIQRFAEDFEDTTDVEESAAKSEESTEQQEQVPEELEFLDEPYRSEALKELKEYQQAQMQEQEPQTQSEEKTQEQPSTPQPIDEVTTLKNEINALKAQLAQVQMQTQRQPPQPQEKPSQRQAQPEFSKQDMALIKQSIHNRALALSGFTQTDLDSFEFADEDDERRERWKFANQAAEREVWDTIYKAKSEYERQRAQVQQELETSRQSFNAFVTNEQKEPDFQQIVNYSMNGYFTKLEPLAQNIVGAAYYRINNNVATPQDAWIVRNYYQNAKADFRSNQQTKATSKAKTTPPPNLPKADLLQGTTSTSGADISMTELERLIDAGDESKIPKKYLDYMNKANVFK